VKAQADGSLVLMPVDCEITGARISIHDKEPYLIWHAGGPNDHVAWLVEVGVAGQYELWLEWAQVDQFAGNGFVLEAGPSRLAGTLDGTGGWGRWQQKRFGTLDLAVGRQRVVLRANGPVKGELSDLRKIRLVPAGR